MYLLLLFVRHVLACFHQSTDRFEVKLLHMNLVVCTCWRYACLLRMLCQVPYFAPLLALRFWMQSRLIGQHKLQLLPFYSFIQRYLNVHQSSVTVILAFLAQVCVCCVRECLCLLTILRHRSNTSRWMQQLTLSSPWPVVLCTFAHQACHSLVPPEELVPVVRMISNNFVSDHRPTEVMQIGLNSLREVFSRTPLVLEEEGMGDLIQVRPTHGHAPRRTHIHPHALRRTHTHTHIHPSTRKHHTLHVGKHVWSPLCEQGTHVAENAKGLIPECGCANEGAVSWCGLCLCFQDLVQYRKFRDTGVVMAARSMLNVIRTLYPAVLRRRDRGKDHGGCGVHAGMWCLH